MKNSSAKPQPEVISGAKLSTSTNRSRGNINRLSSLVCNAGEGGEWRERVIGHNLQWIEIVNSFYGLTRSVFKGTHTEGFHCIGLMKLNTNIDLCGSSKQLTSCCRSQKKLCSNLLLVGILDMFRQTVAIMYFRCEMVGFYLKTIIFLWCVCL